MVFNWSFCNCLLRIERSIYIIMNKIMIIGHTFIDINECRGKSGCNQMCTNLIGSYYCSCNTGYVLYSQNGTSDYWIPPVETGTYLGDTFYIDHTCVGKH